jgi:hypothetical protein
MKYYRYFEIYLSYTRLRGSVETLILIIYIHNIVYDKYCVKRVNERDTCNQTRESLNCQQLSLREFYVCQMIYYDFTKFILTIQIYFLFKFISSPLL